MTAGQAIVYIGVECSDNSITNDMPLQIKISLLNKNVYDILNYYLAKFLK